MAPIPAGLKLAISAAAGLTVGYAAWRLLPPRLTTRQFMALMAGWLATSAVTSSIGWLIFLATVA